MNSLPQAISNEAQGHLRHNYLVNVLDGSFFGLALGIASLTTVLPLFVSHMTSSALLIGLIPSIHTIGWHLPQLFMAPLVSRLPVFRPTVLKATVHERLPFLGLALVSAFLAAGYPSLALVLTFGLLIWQGLGAGFTANPWQNMISKVIPPDMRATFFGVQSAAANLMGGLGALLAGALLQQFPYPQSYTLIFLTASLSLVISWIFLSRTREAPKTVPIESAPSLGDLRRIIHRLPENRAFSGYLVARLLSQFGLMAIGFYIVYASRAFGMDGLQAGFLTSVYLVTQVIANPLLGQLADRWSKKGTLVIGASANAASALLAWLAPNLNWFYAVYVLAGIASVAYWTIGMAFSLDFGSEDERPLYVGLANTLVTPAAILAPLLGGWLADGPGFGATFSLACVASVVTALVLLLFVHDPARRGAS